MNKTTKSILFINGIGAVIIAVSVYFYDGFQSNLDDGLEAFGKRNYLLAESKFINAMEATEGFGEFDSRIGKVSYYLGKTYRHQGKKTDEVEALFDKALSISEENSSDWFYINEIRQELALIYLEQGKYDEAEFLLRAAIDNLKRELGNKIDVPVYLSKSSSEILEQLTFAQDMKRIVSLYGTTQHIGAIDILKSFAAFNYNAGRYHSSELFLNQVYDVLNSLEKAPL